MTPTYRAILAATLLAGPAIASAQASARITTAEIDRHLRFLSSDLLDSPSVPAWNADAEFRSPRVATQP